MHDLDTEQMAAEDDSSIPTDAPTLEEVESTIKKLKLGKTAGGDLVGHKLLKLAPDPPLMHYTNSSLLCGPPVKSQLHGRRALSCRCTRERGSAMFAPITDQFRYFASLAKSLHMCYWDG